ncbi:MAG: Mut7-C RNAse domain-containing protein [Streptosporangiaceae bacterium]
MGDPGPAAGRQFELRLRFAADLGLFLAREQRVGEVRARWDGRSTLGHVVESLGVPLPEVGRLAIGGRAVPPSCRPVPGVVVEVRAPGRPQRLPADRFILDVHLGALARRMRLVGLDTFYGNDLDDDLLINLANAQRRVLLTRDRGLLKRRKLWLGAFVRGDRPDDQLADVVDRFGPALAPWTRCLACNGPLERVPKSAVEHLLRPGTRRTYQDFARCSDCGQVYWRGAHSAHLAQIVARATAATADPRDLAERRGGG